MIPTFALLLALGVPETARPKSPPPPPKVEYVSGCPACCCAMKIPKGISAEKAIKDYCQRGDDLACVKMCGQWLKDRKQNERK